MGARTYRSGRSRSRTGEAVLGRHAETAEHRVRHPPSSAHRSARRTDRGRRSPEPRSHLRDAGRTGSRGCVAPPHDPSSRGSGSTLLADGDHRPRSSDRGRDAAGARRSDGRPSSPDHAPAEHAARNRRDPEAGRRDRSGGRASGAREDDRRRHRSAAAARGNSRRRRGSGRCRVRGPSLQAVFIHLTGRELRE